MKGAMSSFAWKAQAKGLQSMIVEVTCISWKV